MKLLKLITVFLLILPIAYAEIELNPLSYDQYNVGGKVVVSGKVIHDTPTSGFLDFYLNCGNDSSLPLTKKTVYVRGETTFSATNNLIGIADEGSCEIYVSFVVGGSVLYESVTDSFTLTRELDGNFNLDKSELQLGDSLKLTGSINNMAGDGINGLANLYFKKDLEIQFRDGADIVNGVLNYETQIALPAGDYSVEVEVEDVFGNRKIFEDNTLFTIYDKLVIFGSPTKTNYLPGETLNIQGSVSRKIGGEAVDSKVTATIEEQDYTSETPAFDFSYVLPVNIKSNKHIVKVVANDIYGNYGEAEIEYNVQPVLTKVMVSVAKESYLPEEEMEITAGLFDQAGDTLENKADIKLHDPEGVLRYEGQFSTNNPFTLKLPKLAMPGKWALEAKVGNLSDLKDINVAELEALEITLENQILNLLNVGNIPYKKQILIKANELEAYKDLDLNVNKSKNIKLYSLFDPGTYTITVLDKIFDNIQITEMGIISRAKDALVSITGRVIEGGGKVGAIVLIAIIVIVVILGAFSLKGKKKVQEAVRKNEFEEGKKRGQELRDVPKKSPPHLVFGRATEEDKKDFIERLQKKFDEEERAKRRYF